MIPQMIEHPLVVGSFFDVYIQIATRFLANLKKCNVNLVFFVDESIYDPCDSITLMTISKGTMWTNGIEFNNKRVLDDMLLLASKYGKIIVARTTIKRHLIVEYAEEHSRQVLAVISHDTSLLAFDCIFQFWWMSDINQDGGNFQLSGTRLDRKSLLEELDINGDQLRLYMCLTNFFTEHQSHVDVYTVRSAFTSFTREPEWDRIGVILFGKEAYDEETMAVLIERYEHIDNMYRVEKTDDPLENTNPALADLIDFCMQSHIPMYRSIIAYEKRIFFLKDLCCLQKRNPDNATFAVFIYTTLATFPGIFNKDVDAEQQQTKEWEMYNPLVDDPGKYLRGYGRLETREIYYPPGMLRLLQIE